MSELVLAEDRGAVTVLQMQHGKVNALDVELLIAVREAVQSTTQGSAIVLTGNGRAFSAGLDLRALLDAPLGYSGELLGELALACRAIFDHPRPVVAAVDGAAIAGGAMLALAADTRIMSHGVIGLPELRVGVPIPGMLMELARQVLGRHLTQHLLQGAALDPEQALAIGLVDEIVGQEQLRDRALAVAGDLADMPVASYALVKRGLQAAARARMDAVPSDDEAVVASAWQSEEVRAAIARQVERMSKRQ